jgi:hypothetical protein
MLSLMQANLPQQLLHAPHVPAFLALAACPVKEKEGVPEMTCQPQKSRQCLLSKSGGALEMTYAMQDRADIPIRPPHPPLARMLPVEVACPQEMQHCSQETLYLMQSDRLLQLLHLSSQIEA